MLADHFVINIHLHTVYYKQTAHTSNMLADHSRGTPPTQSTTDRPCQPTPKVQYSKSNLAHAQEPQMPTLDLKTGTHPTAAESKILPRATSVRTVRGRHGIYTLTRTNTSSLVIARGPNSQARFFSFSASRPGRVVRVFSDTLLPD